MTSLKTILLNDDTLELIYEEDILENPKVAYDKVCKFLSIAEKSPRIQFRRTNPFTIAEVVVNIAEVRDALKSTKYSWMVDD